MPIAALFLLVATFYSAVGFGGGSSYIAILALYDYPYQLLPVLALLCNLIVVSSSSLQFIKNGHFRWKLFWPFAISSLPMSFLGGRMPVDKSTVFTLLGLCLAAAGIRLLLLDRTKADVFEVTPLNTPLALLLGSSLGFISGLVGIGGGIFLAPLLLTLRWGLPKQVAATAALFILINSVSGLLGQFIKNDQNFVFFEHWPLFVAVFLGGQIGSRFGSGSHCSQKTVRVLTAILVLFVSFRILARL